jgi:hypothetical protein
MENPQTGLLKSQSFMKDIPFFQIMSEQNDLADSSE